jgi:Cu+-exporting ATPase
VDKPRFYRIIANIGYTEDEVLHLAASLDQGSEHPLADAIVQAAREKGLVLDKVHAFDSISGIGVRGVVTGKALALGNAALMTQIGVTVEDLKSQAETLRTEGAS